MTTLYSSLCPVKSARRFGAGLVASRPSYRTPYTAADLAWLTEDDTRRENEHLDRMADESAFLDRYERGLCC